MDLQTEHAQKKELELEEQKRLQCSVEQQNCRCREQQENRYAAQVEHEHVITLTSSHCPEQKKTIYKKSLK